MTDDTHHEELPDDVPPAPFSFKLMIALGVVYLGWRLIEGLVWLWDWAT